MPPSTATPKKVPASANKLKRAGRSSGQRLDADDDLDEWKKSRQLVKPKDQLELPEFELKEIVPRILVTTNTQQPDNLVEFDWATGEFIPIPLPGNTLVLFNMKGTVIHKDTEEAKKQMILSGVDPAMFDISSAPASRRASFASQEEEDDEDAVSRIEEDVHEADEDAEPKDEEEKPEGEKKVEETKAETEAGEGDEEGGGGGGGGGGGSSAGKKLTNQFNFCERAALTYNNPTRCQETQTIPPPMATYSANVLQWIIYDSYQQDFEAQQAEKERERERKEKEKTPISKHSVAPKKIGGRAQLGEAVLGRVYDCWKTLERMVNLNMYDDIAKDYRYWEDPSDEFREEEGTLLPLWKFVYDKTKKNTITDILWNPWYYDFFAVCFGYLDFMKPIEEGAVCLFTIKNPSFPEYICMTESAVLCADIHPTYPYMLVIGLYNGNVCVYNVHASCKAPAFKSNNVTQKHDGLVWEVKWAPDLPDGEMNFFSVAADGRVNNWVLMQNALAVTTVLILFLAKDPVPGPDGTLVKMKGCASCIMFHPKQPLIYLVGTEEGLIYKCSTAYSSSYLLTYKAHHMPVYRIDFNKYNSDIFASCSGDWRIKIWEDKRLEPLFVFDLGACVGDVKWAPYSSTVFAAVTTEGKVYVFDLNVNKYKPVCVQAVVSKKKYKLTRIAFNLNLPILIVGDDKGCTTTLKLSPNLRIPCKPPKKQQHLDQWTLQCMKLDRLLALVREPLTLTVPADPANSDTS